MTAEDSEPAKIGEAAARVASNPCIRDDAPMRQAARVVMEEMGANARRYATMRARTLDRRGDSAGATAWRRVAPVIEQLERESKKGAAENGAEAKRAR